MYDVICAVIATQHIAVTRGRRVILQSDHWLYDVICAVISTQHIAVTRGRRVILQSDHRLYDVICAVISTQHIAVTRGRRVILQSDHWLYDVICAMISLRQDSGGSSAIRPNILKPFFDPSCGVLNTTIECCVLLCVTLKPNYQTQRLKISQNAMFFSLLPRPH